MLDLHPIRLWTAILVPIVLVVPCRAQDTIAPAKPYAEAVRQLEKFIEHEVQTKELPALSVALVDGQTIVWARGFGYVDPKKKRPATAETIYRVGSVSKLFTDLALMQLVEKGAIDLDAPVSRYLPDFKPTSRFDKPLTLRMMLSHRSGLVREPPIGNYFDPTEPSIEATVRSMNQTALVYEPGAKIKYSNAAIGTAGYVLERTQKEPFAKYLRRTLLEPMNLKKSSFKPSDAIRKDLAKAVMWTYHGRIFDAPTFEIGTAPAGSMYTTVIDLGHFLSILFADGKGPNGAILKPETLKLMYEPQFAKPGDKTGFGIGFYLTEFEGQRRIGHGGAIYGFATELAALPAEKVGVVVVSSKDCANAVTTHIGEIALRQLLAIKHNKPLPKIETTAPLKPEEARRLAGRYQSGAKIVDLHERAGKLWAMPARGGYKLELRKLGDDLIVDDVHDYGLKIQVKGETLQIRKDEYKKVEVAKPAPPPKKWLGLIGEYGWDHNTLYILEKDAKLQCLIEWIALYPLKEVSENVFEFPDFGLYHGEKLIFTRDKTGRATKVEAANVVFARRKIDGENGETFRIEPLRPVDELRREALAATPPKERGEFGKTDLVEVVSLDPSIKLDIRYASTNNFLSKPFYSSAKAFLQRPAAEAVVRVHKKLEKQDYGLLIHDGYRPWFVTKMFWEATPEKQRLFVANPSEGSRHNRGCAVDLTMFDRKTGKPVVMPGGYDEMSDRSWADYPAGSSLQRWQRDLLRRAMEDEGFTVYEAEWWHFDYKDWRKHSILNLAFEDLGKGK